MTCTSCGTLRKCSLLARGARVYMWKGRSIAGLPPKRSGAEDQRLRASIQVTKNKVGDRSKATFCSTLRTPATPLVTNVWYARRFCRCCYCSSTTKDGELAYCGIYSGTATCPPHIFADALMMRCLTRLTFVTPVSSKHRCRPTTKIKVARYEATPRTGWSQD